MAVEINGLPLPAELVAAIEDGAWHAPADEAVCREVFGDDPVTPAFHGLAGLERENRSWRTASLDGFQFEPSPGNLGLDRSLSVLIADLGPDMPVVLDYRQSRQRPRVLYLGGDGLPRWFEVAPDIGALLTRLSLR